MKPLPFMREVSPAIGALDFSRPAPAPSPHRKRTHAGALLSCSPAGSIVPGKTWLLFPDGDELPIDDHHLPRRLSAHFGFGVSIGKYADAAEELEQRLPSSAGPIRQARFIFSPRPRSSKSETVDLRRGGSQALQTVDPSPGIGNGCLSRRRLDRCHFAYRQHPRHRH